MWRHPERCNGSGATCVRVGPISVRNERETRPAQRARRAGERRTMDDDLDQLSRDALVDEVRRLRNAIRAHRDSSGHDLCWHHPDLWGLLPEQTDPVPTVPEWPVFIRGCVSYRQSLDEQLPDAPRTTQPFPG